MNRKNNDIGSIYEHVESFAKIGSWVLDIKNYVLKWSDGVYTMLGYEPQEFEISHETGINIIHPADRDEAMRLMEETITTGKEYSTKKRLISKDRKIIYVKSTAQLFYDVDGSPLKLVGLFQDITDFMKSEQIIEEQNTLVHDVIKKLPSAFFLFNQKGQHLLWNEKLESYTGYDAEEIATINPINFYEGEDKEKINWHIKKVLDEGYTEVQAWLTTKSKEKIPLYFTASTIQYNGQKCIFGTATDITQSFKLERNLKSATEIARLGAWEVNLLSGITSWSDMTREVHEVPAKFVPTLDQGIDFYHPDFQPLVEAAIEESLRTGQSFDFEAKIITAKGNERWIRSVGNAEMRNGKCVRLFGSVQDIHERKTVEQRLTNISDNVPGVLFRYHLKPDGTDFIDYVSDGASSLWGLAPEIVMADINKVWAGIEKGGEIEKVKEAIAESARKMSRFHLSWRYITPCGEIRYHICDANPERASDGTIIWDTIITDATDLQYYERMASRVSEIARIGSWELHISKDGDKSKIYWSPATRQILEVKSDYNPSITGGIEFYTEESKAIAEKAIDRLIETGEKFDLELLLRTRTGKLKWVRCIGDADKIENKVVRIYGSFQDIDKQKRTELAVQDVLTEKEEILESIGDVFYAVDQNWKVTYWNKEAEVILGKSRQSILLKNLWEVLGENGYYYNHYKRAIEKDRQVQFEDYFPKLDKWFEINAYPSKNGLSVFFTDISKIKRAEKTLKESNDRFELAALATNDSIWDWDITSNKTRRAGSGFERIFGYRAEIIDLNLDLWSSRVHPEDLERVIKSKNNILEKRLKDFWTCEYRFKKKNGKYANVIDRGYIVRDDQGKAIRMIGATTDITSQKQYEESLIRVNDQLRKQAQELKSSNAELEQFAYVASHDLQEPLRMVSGFLSQLEKKYGNKLDDRAHQYINFATDGAARMRQIILDLLDFSRIGKEDEKEVDVDLNEILQEVCVLNRKKIQEFNATISFADLPIVKAHPTLMFQLFQNLINNGIKYSREGIEPEIFVTAQEHDREWRFAIEDNGIGIEEQYFNKIFNIFQRLHNRNEFSGTGMGLAIVKKIIDNGNGKIWLKSEVGKGTIFYFTLPKRIDLSGQKHN